MIDVEFKNVSKTYNPGLFKKKVLAVDNLNLQIRQGEVFGLIGPNGAGKSTSIRLLLGLLRPTSGEILFRGEPLAEVCVQKHIGYLPENPYLYDHLTLWELLVFCGSTSGMQQRTIQARSDELLSRLDLAAVSKRPLRTFSKGMLQRAGICFALLHDPPVVIFDEPMSGLDPIGRKMVFDLVAELKEKGKTIFFCSHILSDVERLCDRIGIMVMGRLADEVSAKEFMTKKSASVSLELQSCTDEFLGMLTPLVNRIEKDGNLHLIDFPLENFFHIIDLIREEGAEILSCRSAQASLENHFLDMVRGGRG